jgi:hypothetical protein
VKLWAERPMPTGERRTLTGVAVLAWVLALGVNVGHVADHLRQLGFGVWLAVMPDFFLLLGVWKLRYRPKSAVAWISLAIGLSWLVWAALSTTAADSSHRIVALAPIGGAVVATLLLEFGEVKSPTEPEPSPAPAPSRPRTVRPPRARPVREVEPTEPDPRPGDHVVMPEPEPEPTKAPCPSRARAREILLALDDLGSVSNGQLSREHGGSDVFWSQRKRDLAAELDRLGLDAPVT